MCVYSLKNVYVEGQIFVHSLKIIYIKCIKLYIFFKNCVHSCVHSWKLCTLNVHIPLHSMKYVHIKCTQLCTFIQNVVHWMYTFIYIFQKLCILIVYNCVPSLKKCVHSIYTFEHFMNIIQVECTQLSIFLEKNV